MNGYWSCWIKEKTLDVDFLLKRLLVKVAVAIGVLLVYAGALYVALLAAGHCAFIC